MNIPVFTLATAYGQLTVAQYGGQLLSWRSAEGQEQLYTPDCLRLEPGRALRGGVPVCFPQFSGRGGLPKHGLVRTRPWHLLRQTDDALVLSIRDDDNTRALWPHAFELTQTLTLAADGLSVGLQVHNRGRSDFAFTAALHTYLRVPDVTACALCGLDGREYEDAADGGRRKPQSGDLRVVGEVDRVFADAPDALRLRRPGMGDLQIRQGGFPDTVVWCPGPALAGSFTDMPASDWRRMLCVEAAAADRPIRVPADGHWQGWQRLTAL